MVRAVRVDPQYIAVWKAGIPHIEPPSILDPEEPLEKVMRFIKEWELAMLDQPKFSDLNNYQGDTQ